MDEKKLELILGSMLHDVGKLLFRNYDGRRHSRSGAEFFKEKLHIENDTIVDIIAHHHYAELKQADLPGSHLAYITYIADNIAAFSDRRQREEGMEFDAKVNLESIFNHLNGNADHAFYQATMIKNNRTLFPGYDYTSLTESFYGEILGKLQEHIRSENITPMYLQSFLDLLESTLSYVPSSTNTKEYVDISLYDHLKITTAYACAIYDYLQAHGRCDYKEELLKKSQNFYNEPAFLLVKLDMSGIQSFIYQITKEKALKHLRARSFYLDLMLEHIADELLDRLDLIRANLLYIGGGGAYLLLSNTEESKRKLDNIKSEINQWFMDEFGTDLYLSLAYTEACPNYFKNEPTGSYAHMFKLLTEKISRDKIKRYTYEDIQYLNHRKQGESERECKNCNRTDTLNDENLCHICNGLMLVSQKIFTKDFFAITSAAVNEDALPLPLGKWMTPVDKEILTQMMANDDSYVRAYSKNQFHIGERLSTNLWVGDYNYDKLLSALDDKVGIERLGVLRADVDNLGQTFVSGFNQNNNHQLVSLSRTATLSRLFSTFFKLNINYILENGEYHFIENIPAHEGKRQCNIIYSGGDDIFLIGHWADVIEFAVDLQRAFSQYTLGSVTLSAGIGLYHSSYPVSHMAEETAELEAAAKSYVASDGTQKNAICLFEPKFSFSWAEFTEKVIGEKHKLLKEYVEIMYPHDAQTGHSTLYQLLYYLRNIDEQINFPRVLYLLSNKDAATPAAKDIKAMLLGKLYDWLKNKNDRKQLEMAIILLAYEHRGENNG
ncbi:MAG: type III-A CRISPR-associated protein Cas10/Csm1 [Peptococcus niger]|nr:type III-A CRISPR-associated protein Cas10/Csm1 [Peptococcus niger]